MAAPERLALIVLALGLAALAVPRWTSAALLLESGPTLARLQTGAPVSEKARQAMVGDARAALAWTASPEAWRRLEAATASEDATRGRLAVAPSDAYAWARLAHLRLAAGDRAGARRAVERSLALGPWERPLITDRLPVIAAVLPPDDPRARRQLAAAWAWDRPRLLHILPVTTAWPLYRRALGGDAEALTAAARLSGLFTSRVGMD